MLSDHVDPMDQATPTTQRVQGPEMAFPTSQPSLTAEVRDWCCAKCDLVQPRPPETLLLGGYGRDHCSSCDKRTIWMSSELKGILKLS